MFFEKDKVSKEELDALLAAIVESSEDAIIGKRLDGTITSWNRGAEKIYGYTEKEMIGRNISAIIPADRKNEMPKFHERLRQGESIKRFETVRIKKDNTPIDVSVTISPIKDRLGNIVGASTIARDITEHNKIENALRDSEEKYRALFDSSSDAIMTLEPPSWKFTGCNQATIKIFGVKDEKEFISLSPWELSPEYQPDGRLSVEKAQAMIDKAMKEGSNFFEWTHRRHKKEAFPAAVLLTRVKIKGKDLVQATVRDITELKNMEEKLISAAKEWDRTFNAISDLIFILDKDYNIIRVNEAFAKAMKKTPEELIGIKCYKILHNSDKPWPVCPAERSQIDNLPHIEEVEDPNIGVPLLVTVSPIFDDKGKFNGCVHIARDISVIKKAEDELRKRVDELELFRRFTVARELKMKELKARIVELEAKIADK